MLLSEGSDYHLGHFVNAAMLVVTVPRQIDSIQTYYSLIAPQLIFLLFSENHNIKKTVSIVIQKMLQNHSKICKMTVMEPISSPLLYSSFFLFYFYFIFIFIFILFLFLIYFSFFFIFFYFIFILFLFF